MAYILALFVITVLSLLVIRVGATALTMTGLSWDTDSFQSYSAFFGVGFTTKEAVMVVNHPVRRRIIRDLISGIPGPRTVVQPGDVVTAYGHEHDLKKLLLKECPVGPEPV